jgi:ElaB/YqjD/DUF883 family membrane-anchored ribosome-binding protein
MSATKGHRANSKTKGTDAFNRFSNNLDDLQANFTELRADLASLLTNTVDTGKSGAAVMKNGASSTIQELQGRLIQAKERGLESLEKVGEQIHKHPIISSAVAMGIGFILAKLLTMRSSAKYSD